MAFRLDNTADTGATGASFADNLFQIYDNLDATKKLRFEISGSSTTTLGVIATHFTGNTTIDLPDGGTTLVGFQTSLGALTTGSVLFVNGTYVAQDNANFFYDSTLHRLGLGTTTPSALLDIHIASGNLCAQFNNVGAQGVSAGAYLNAVSDPGAAMLSGSRLGVWGYGGTFDASHTIVNAASIAGFATENWSVGARGSKIVFSTTTNLTTGQNVVLTLDNDKSATFTGVVNGTSVSMSGNINGASLSWTGTTLGSVVFVDGGGIFAQDNANFFYDSTNHKLGLGLTAPQNRLHIDAGTATASNLQFTVGATTGQGSGNGCLFGILSNGNQLISSQGGGNSILFETNGGNQRLKIDNNGNVAVQNGAGSQLATNATDGFLYLSSCAGAPTGVARSLAGTIPVIIDTTNNLFYFYNSGWRQVATRFNPFAAKTANYTILITDSVLTGDCTGGSFTFTLPTAVGNTGLQFTFKRIDASANKITIDANAAETIDGNLTQILGSKYDYLTICSDGANWDIVEYGIFTGMSAINSSAQSIPNNTLTTVTNWTTQTDPQGNFNATTGIFTAPITGKYMVSSMIGWASIAGSPTAGAFWALNLLKNGVSTQTLGAISTQTGGSTGRMYPGGCFVISLVVGDTLAISAFQNSNSAQPIGSDTFLSISLCNF